VANELKSVDLSGAANPANFYGVWVGQERSLQRITEDVDGIVVFTHRHGTPVNQWNMTVPTDKENDSIHIQLSQLLAALHDHCCRIGVVPERTWKTPTEMQNEAASKQTQPSSQHGRVRATATDMGKRTISIPLDSPEAAERVQKALGGLMTPGTDGKKVVETLRANPRIKEVAHEEVIAPDAVPE